MRVPNPPSPIHMAIAKCLWPALLTWLMVGCSHTPPEDPFASSAMFAPLPPIFLSGSAALLLTNQSGFSARLVAQGAPVTASGEGVSGQLLGRGSKLLFAPDEDKTKPKRARIGGISFIWDVARNQGYVLSDALQGYSPISTSLCFTNIVFRSGSTGSVPAPQEALVTAADGSVSTYQIWPASNLGGFPMRIAAVGGGGPLALTFSKVKLELPPADIFQPPDGFTRYPSVEAMMTEMTLRQHNLRRKPGENWDRGDLMTPPAEHAPR